LQGNRIDLTKHASTLHWLLSDTKNTIPWVIFNYKKIENEYSHGVCIQGRKFILQPIPGCQLQCIHNILTLPGG
jgi:hypothetical protein